MSDVCGRRRLAKLAFVTGASGNLRGFLEEPVHTTYNDRLTDPFAFHVAFLEKLTAGVCSICKTTCCVGVNDWEKEWEKHLGAVPSPAPNSVEAWKLAWLEQATQVLSWFPVDDPTPPQQQKLQEFINESGYHTPSELLEVLEKAIAVQWKIEWEKYLGAVPSSKPNSVKEWKSEWLDQAKQVLSWFPDDDPSRSQQLQKFISEPDLHTPPSERLEVLEKAIALRWKTEWENYLGAVPSPAPNSVKAWKEEWTWKAKMVRDWILHDGGCDRDKSLTLNALTPCIPPREFHTPNHLLEVLKNGNAQQWKDQWKEYLSLPKRKLSTAEEWKEEWNKEAEKTLDTLKDKTPEKADELQQATGWKVWEKSAKEAFEVLAKAKAEEWSAEWNTYKSVLPLPKGPPDSARGWIYKWDKEAQTTLSQLRQKKKEITPGLALATGWKELEGSAKKRFDLLAEAKKGLQ